MKTITFIMALLLLASGAYTQNSKFKEIEIKTSSQCEMCKERIEETLAFERGVKKSSLDLETQIVKVRYKPSRTTPEKIRKAISKAGYDADAVKADEKAYAKLPACCKKPDEPEAKPHMD